MAKLWKLWFYFLLIFLWSGTTMQKLYKLKDYTGAYLTQMALQENVSSILICALYAGPLGGAYLIYEDGVCSVYDVGSPSPSNSSLSIYMPYDPYAMPSVIENRAFNKPTIAAPYYFTHVGSRAVDSDLDTQYHSNTVTDTWWSVDLLGLYFIRKVDVLPHTQVPSWFKQIKIYVGNTTVTNGYFSAYTEIAYFIGPWNGVGRVEFTPPQGVIAGRYVGIQGISGTEFLNLQDVKVMA
ncbi:hypothetical protein SK128_012670 [Halocaridina rubra]|uniref:F5/8 type C domain-containing protein n=1 Tax=Halocaridina rubra TaxID=373956 RepID=A0AAN8X4W5_HALRR